MQSCPALRPSRAGTLKVSRSGGPEGRVSSRTKLPGRIDPRTRGAYITHEPRLIFANNFNGPAQALHCSPLRPFFIPTTPPELSGGTNARKFLEDDPSQRSQASSTAFLIASKLNDSAHVAPLLSSLAGLVLAFSIFTPMSFFLLLTSMRGSGTAGRRPPQPHHPHLQRMQRMQRIYGRPWQPGHASNCGLSRQRQQARSRDQG